MEHRFFVLRPYIHAHTSAVGAAVIRVTNEAAMILDFEIIPPMSGICAQLEAVRG